MNYIYQNFVSTVNTFPSKKERAWVYNTLRSRPCASISSREHQDDLLTLFAISSTRVRRSLFVIDQDKNLTSSNIPSKEIRYKNSPYRQARNAAQKPIRRGHRPLIDLSRDILFHLSESRWVTGCHSKAQWLEKQGGSWFMLRLFCDEEIRDQLVGEPRNTNKGKPNAALGGGACPSSFRDSYACWNQRCVTLGSRCCRLQGHTGRSPATTRPIQPPRTGNHAYLLWWKNTESTLTSNFPHDRTPRSKSFWHKSLSA